MFWPLCVLGEASANDHHPSKQETIKKTFGKMHLFLLALIMMENILVLIVFLVVLLVIDLIVDIVNFVVDIDDDVVHVGNVDVVHVGNVDAHVVSVPLDFLNAVGKTKKATDRQSNQEPYPPIQISKFIANLQLSTTLVLLIRLLLVVVA
jgi:hypothetical protein